ncbi:Rrf2 family transcriptional regulator [Limosilactobacillus viscerum]|uniref:Rrf2 family transcriptional regulator n=1 Tax=Limosilactobacillus viscerum TaxID=2993450 RepID=UPI0024BB24F5|nr:Rrf2 family transcriptional regulator [Limosilactobacillus viscerum]
MKYSHRLSDAVHILVYLEILGSNSSSAIADSVNSNPSLIRRLIARMVKAGILDRSGQRGEINIRLTRPAGKVNLLQIYQAVEDHQQFIDVDQEVNRLEPLGRSMPAVLSGEYDRVQTAAEQEMAKISLESIVDQVKGKIED